MADSHDTDARRPPNGAPPEGLAARLEGQIARRACGRIRDLRVICEAGQITIEGRSRTYHARQLALQAVLDLVDVRATLADQIIVS